MTAKEQQRAAEAFVAHWTERRGSEKGEDQTFWNSLLGEVLGVSDVKGRIRYQEPVCFNDGSTKYLDAWIPETQVLIEHKSRGIDLDAPQAGHHGQTPFEQAWDYDNNRPRRDRARWIVVCNFDEIRVHDMEADRPAHAYQTILLKDLAKEAHRLSFLVTEVESVRDKEARVSVEAGRVVGKLYAAFLEELDGGRTDVHLSPSPKLLNALNVLCVRLVFCVYAEDAGVFGKDQFLNFLRPFRPASFHLQLRELFKVLAQRVEERSPLLPPELRAFPYVGGGLFRDEFEIPVFSEKVAHILLDEASEHFDWSEISPTIFGAVFESTLNPETRRKGGMHYTSEENIHKVIDPLFLDELRDELRALRAKPAGKARDRELEAYQRKLGSLRFLDPACGSGNFLTETYLSLRKLENEALEMRFRGQGQFDLDDCKLIHVSIGQFFGLEINDFAVTVAQTAMWIAECKMMEETNRILSKNFTPLPLTDSANIVEGNALKMDWGELLNVEPATFSYIMGNPPFIGYSNQSSEQKADMMSIFVDAKGKPLKTAGKIDYVAAWYWKACEYAVGGDHRAPRCAFVSTNSITQGEQVAAVWKPLKERFALEIDYAWTTFVWDSEASDKAHVHVVIVGFHTGGPCLSRPEGNESGRDKRVPPKRLFHADGTVVEAAHINGYLMDGPDVFVESHSKPLCDVPLMTAGNRPADGGHLIIEAGDYDEFVNCEPAALPFIKRFVGSEEFINAKKRYCLWLKEITPGQLRAMPLVYKRVELCREDRLNAVDAGRRKLADTPTLFREQMNPTQFLIVPKVSSERRFYAPIGFEDKNTIASDLLFIIPNATLYHFGVLTSSVHMAWMRVVAGRLKSDYRYSAAIVYNNFPWPECQRTDDNGQRIESAGGIASTNYPLSSINYQLISSTAQSILDARARYSDSSLADLYDPLTMPPELRKAHAANDAAVMKAYGFAPNLTESEIVSRLFEMYAKLVKA